MHATRLSITSRFGTRAVAVTPKRASRSRQVVTDVCAVRALPRAVCREMARPLAPTLPPLLPPWPSTPPPSPTSDLWKQHERRPINRRVVVLCLTAKQKFWEEESLLDLITGSWTKSNMSQLVRLHVVDFQAKNVPTNNAVAFLRLLDETVAPGSRYGLAFNSNILSLSHLTWLIGEHEKRGGARPTLLVHLADEWGKNPPFDSYKRAVDSKGTVLRQYHHAGYSYPRSPRVLIMPLGFGRNYLPANADTDSCSVARRSVENLYEQRKTTVFFKGSPHSLDRQAMIESFQNWSHNAVISGKLIKIQELFAHHRRASFVLAPRGHVSLECFRHYEATLAGAIPVTVGSTKEIKASLGAAHHDPPFLFADSWPSAQRAVEELLHPSRADALAQRRLSLAVWYCEWLWSVRRVVHRGFFS